MGSTDLESYPSDDALEAMLDRLQDCQLARTASVDVGASAWRTQVTVDLAQISLER